MSAEFVAVDEWIHETEQRLAEASTSGRAFFAVPEIREAAPEDLELTDPVFELRARKARNAREHRARRRTLFH